MAEWTDPRDLALIERLSRRFELEHEAVGAAKAELKALEKRGRVNKQEAIAAAKAHLKARRKAWDATRLQLLEARSVGLWPEDADE